MDLNARKWYVRWYFWSASLWFHFRDESFRDVERDTNLCFFLRALLVYTPLVLLANLYVWAALLGVTVLLPIHYWGGASVGKAWAVIGALAAFAITLFVLVPAIGTWALDWHRARETRRIARELAGEPSFGSLLWQGLVAAKRSICPLIHFDNIAPPPPDSPEPRPTFVNPWSEN